MTPTEQLFDAHQFIIGRSISSLGLSGDPEVEDLEQEARLALVKAVREFDPDAGYKLSSFAIPRVRGAILEYRRSRCSWVRRPGQKAKANVEAALVTLELRGEPVTEAAVRALLADPRDYAIAAALPVLVPLVGEFDEPLYEELADGGPDLLEVVWEREGAALIERAVRRLTALDRAVFRGRVQRDMTPREVARRLDIPPGEVTRRLNNSLSLLRRYLDRVAARFAQKPSNINLDRKMPKKRGRPPGRIATHEVHYLADAETRERSLQLAARLDVSEAEVNRRGIEALWRQEMAADPRVTTR